MSLVRKGTLFSSTMVLSFHTVLFLKKIRKILKMFCQFRWRMRLQVDRPKWLNSQDLFSFGNQKWIKILRALLCVMGKQTDEQNWIHRTFFFGGPKELIMGLNLKDYLKANKCVILSNSQNKSNKVYIHSTQQVSSIEF